MLDELKSALDERDTAIGKKLTAVETENKTLRGRVEELEANRATLKGGDPKDGLTGKDREHGLFVQVVASKSP